MTGPVYFGPLSSGNARQIAALQKQGFAAPLREPVKEIAEILRNAEQYFNCNYSFGLFDGTQMVGYLFAYIESESLFHEQAEEVLYMKELVLVHGYESYLHGMFTKLAEQRQAFAPHIPLEAHADSESLNNWQRIKRTYRHYGLSLQSRADPNPPIETTYHLLRWSNRENARESRVSRRKLSLNSTTDADISVTLIKDTRQWAALKTVWDDLLRKTQDYTVFQSFDYLYTWWQNFGLWNELRIFVFHRGDKVIGVSPLMLEYFTQFGKVYRHLLFVTASMEMSRPKLILGEETEACQAILGDYLHEHRDKWDCIAIEEQLCGTATNSLAAMLSAKGYFIARTKTLCPYIELHGSWDDFKRGLSKRMRSNISRLRRKLADAGSVEVHQFNHWPELKVALEQFSAIEERSWKYRKNLYMAADREHYFFYQQLAEIFGSRRQFQLRHLSCDQEIMSSTFGINFDGVFHSLKITHASDHNKLSPGTILESYEIEQLFNSGTKKYEFMGSFLTNKLRWTNNSYETDNLHVFQPQPRLALIYYIFFVLEPGLKVFLKRIGLFDKVKTVSKRISAWRERKRENRAA